MTRERLEAILAAYGADPKRWPAAERDAALAFARANAIDLSEAKITDALLDLAPPPAPPSDLLMARVLRAAPKAAAASLRIAALALAACMILGVLIGYGAGKLAPASGGDELAAVALDPLASDGGAS